MMLIFVCYYCYPFIFESELNFIFVTVDVRFVLTQSGFSQNCIVSFQLTNSKLNLFSVSFELYFSRTFQHIKRLAYSICHFRNIIGSFDY